MKYKMIAICFLLCGCGHQTESHSDVSLVNAKNSFATKIVKDGKREGAPDSPDGRLFKMVHYKSKVGKLAAYVTPDPGDGKKHPAVVWITGGDTNSIGDVWSPQDESNDQSASPLWKNGLVVMFPSQRGGNDNPGHREGFYGEVDDIIDATKYLSKMQYVDSGQVYLGGHSTGGTLAMLVGESTDMYKAVFSLGPVSDVSQYGSNYEFYDVRDQREVFLRSPINWLSAVMKPMFVFEGLEEGNWGSIQSMVKINENPNIHFIGVEGFTHFSEIYPVLEVISKHIISNDLNITSGEINKR